MTRKGILFIISGPSGVGKGTIKDVVLRKITDIKLSISATTRSPRSGETSGTDYFFVNEDTFQQLINNDELLEWANVYGNMYGTPRQFVEESMTRGQDVMLEIDIQGALQIKQRKPDGVFIFICPPSIEELSLRLATRATDTPESITLRLAACKWEMAQVKHYDYVVLNRELQTAVDTVCAIITAERCKVKNINLERDMIDSTFNPGPDGSSG
ncbi:MAG: guanylate kinase [Syntrophomonadaceae bacterium]|nr:guanylate kinase [Syntrophomonadaceae bacterium]